MGAMALSEEDRLTAAWPLAGLRVRTERLELRFPTQQDLLDLIDEANAGVHDPATMPFLSPWTDAPPQDRARGLLQWHWGLWSSWQPTDWKLSLAVVHEGRAIGVQDVFACDFALLREVTTGSWLGRRHAGRGLGTQMRQAVLHLAFDALEAGAALSEAFTDNAASLRVSAKLGYRPDGVETVRRRGAPATVQRLRLSREDWAASDRPPVEVTGLAACRQLFGL